MKLHAKILDTIEENGFVYDYEDDDTMICLSGFTPAGEDWFMEFPLTGADEDFVKAIRAYADDFDVDEEAAVWVERRGQNGVPSSIRTLVEDAEWKKRALGMLANCLEDCLGAMRKKYYAIRVNKTYTGVILVEASEDMGSYGAKRLVEKAFVDGVLKHREEDTWVEVYEDTGITEDDYTYYPVYDPSHKEATYELYD